MFFNVCTMRSERPVCLWIIGGTGKVLNTIGFSEIFEFLGAVLFFIIDKQLDWNALFCKDAKVSQCCL